MVAPKLLLLLTLAAAVPRSTAAVELCSCCFFWNQHERFALCDQGRSKHRFHQSSGVFLFSYSRFFKNISTNGSSIWIFSLLEFMSHDFRRCVRCTYSTYSSEVSTTSQSIFVFKMTYKNRKGVLLLRMALHLLIVYSTVNRAISVQCTCM